MAKSNNKISSVKAMRTFLKVGSCSETTCNVINRAYDDPLELEENAMMPFAGGIMQHGYQCGLIWGAALAAGAHAYRLHGSSPEAEARAIKAAQRLVESFLAHKNTINCYEITEIDKSSSTMQMITYFLLKGGTIGCLRLAGKYAQIAFREMENSFSETEDEAPPLPVSCASILAEKMGLSDMQKVMVSGFAGGIGLCGGACGALGAAIWSIGMKCIKEGDGKVDFKDPRALEVIEKFLESSDYKFECSEIVGRKFENVSDHADYIRNGGCSKIIEALAAD